MKKYNLRAITAQCIAQVLDQGLSLSSILPEQQQKISDKDKALLQELCFGVLRTLPLLNWYLQQLMAKELTGKQRVLHYLLLVGLYQIIYTRIPPHAAVAETVNGVIALKRPQLKGLVNGVLRQFQRQQAELEAKAQGSESQYLHPNWLITRLKKTYPENWQSIIAANNQKPPMWVRVNNQFHTRQDYLAILQQADIMAKISDICPNTLLLLTPQPVTNLPGFQQGWVTVQDVSAQESVLYLDPKDDELILDLCAAPGGKTTHILEVAPKANVVAVDIDERRLERIKENLLRLHQQAEVIVGDGKEPEKWSPYPAYDKILLDAPCSATGVIRRHPDIKWLRRDSDIAELVKLQQDILNAIWPYLKPNGTLIYATCSILPEENEQQIETFLRQHNDAKIDPLTKTNNLGKQNLPTPAGGDGFFYAKLIKIS